MRMLTMLCSGTFAALLGVGLPDDVEAKDDNSEPADTVPAEAEREEPAHGDMTLPPTAAETTPDAPSPDFSMGGGGAMAQFQVPQLAPAGASFLRYQYAIGSESNITYRRNDDLDRQRHDNSLILAPQINGYVIYRPTERLETMLELILEREIPVDEEKVITLPNGTTQTAPKRYTSLAIDQAFVTFKRLGPIDLTLGRRNFEDDRHWLYDSSLDVVFAKSRHGAFQAEASAGRKDRFDGDLLAPVQKTRVDNYMLYLDYRTEQDIRLAGYSILRQDQSGLEGKPLHLGLRAYGMPSDRFNFWSELGLLRGKDERNQNFHGHALDVGFTYRFASLPLHPSITLGYAYGSGDDNPRDGRNTEFRQTGLHSNEWRMSGVSKFKYYGEVLDPDLSNLEIFTAGLGFQPAQNVFVDLVYHRYRLNKLADEIRNWALTAQMNQDDTQLSKDVGQAFDVVLGVRRLFGVPRLGLDLRMGWFLPGNAFRIEQGDPDAPTFHRASKGISVLAKFWY